MREKPEHQTNVTPQKIIEDLWAARATQALVTGIELDVFTHISAGKHTVKEIARAAKASDDGMERLLDALVGLGYLNKKKNRYGLKPIAEKFLISGKDSYIGDFTYETRLTWDGWSRLTEVIRSGRPVERVDSEESGREFFPKLVSAIFPLSFSAARAVVSALSDKTRKKIKSMLDVAAGSGAWSLAFAERFGVASRYSYIEGNLRDLDFGSNRYDLIILGHIIHSEGEKWGRKLIKKSYRALKDGGLLLIAEVIPNDARTGPSIALLFSLNMLLHTDQGNVFTLREYKLWLKETGFKKITTIEAPTPSPLILATK